MIARAAVYTKSGRKYFVLVPSARSEADAADQAFRLVTEQGQIVTRTAAYKQDQSNPVVENYIDEDGQWH